MTTSYHPLREAEYPDDFPWNLPNVRLSDDPAGNWLDTKIPLPDSISQTHRRDDWNRNYRNQPRDPRERAGFRRTNNDDLRRTGYRSLRNEPEGEDTDEDEIPPLKLRRRRKTTMSLPPPLKVYNGNADGLLQSERVQAVRRVEDRPSAPVESDFQNPTAIGTNGGISGAAGGVQRPLAMQPPPQTTAVAVGSSVAAQAYDGSIPRPLSGQRAWAASIASMDDFNQAGSCITGPGAPGPSGSSYSAFAPLNISMASNLPYVLGLSNGVQSPSTAVGSGAPTSAVSDGIPGGTWNGRLARMLSNDSPPGSSAVGSNAQAPGAVNSIPRPPSGQQQRLLQPNGLQLTTSNIAESSVPAPAVDSNISSAPRIPQPSSVLHQHIYTANTSGSSALIRVAKPQQQRVREAK